MDDDKYIVRGDKVDPKYTIISQGSLGEFYLNKFQELGNTVVFINAQSGEKLTANKLRSNSIRIAECLQSFGIKSGDTVGICTENRFEFLYILFGTIYLGATIAAFNVTYTENELDHAVKLAKPKVIFFATSAINTVNKIIKRNPFIANGILFGNSTDFNFKSDPQILLYSEFINNENVTRSTDFKCDPQNVQENVALLLFSSGTTGLSKGVQFTQKNIFFLNIRSIYDGLESSKDTVIFLPLPWFHAYACIYLFGIIFNFSRTIFLPKYDSRSFLEAIQKYRVTRVYVAPPILVYIAKNPLVHEFDLSSVRVIGTGAAAVSRELCQFVEKRLPNVKIINSYGMTEMMSVSGQNSRFCKTGSCGGLRRGISGKVIDIETGKILGRNQSGELLFKGENIMKGYIDNVKETNKFIDKDGWGHSGDIGYFDDDGELFVVDRLKELIKYKGFQVPPAEIEAILLSHPSVSDAAVIGIPNERAGEIPLAFVVTQKGQTLSAKELIDFVAEKVSPSKRLYGGVRFIDEIPKNVTGKILRKELKKLAIADNGTNFKSKL